MTALGTYAEPPTNAQLAAAELAEGAVTLVARLANALYGSLAHVMTAEVAVAQAGPDDGYRGEAWRVAGADGEGIAILLALPRCDERRGTGDSERLPVVWE